MAKASEHIKRIGNRAHWQPQRVLVTGARCRCRLRVQCGLDVHVVDLVTDRPTPRLVESLGATYHSTPAAELDLAPDVVLAATGVGAVIADALGTTPLLACVDGVKAPHPAVLDVFDAPMIECLSCTRSATCGTSWRSDCRRGWSGGCARRMTRR